MNRVLTGLIIGAILVTAAVCFPSCSGVSVKEKVAYNKGCLTGMLTVIDNMGASPNIAKISDYCKLGAESQIEYKKSTN